MATFRVKNKHKIWPLKVENNSQRTSKLHSTILETSRKQVYEPKDGQKDRFSRPESQLKLLFQRTYIKLETYPRRGYKAENNAQTAPEQHPNSSLKKSKTPTKIVTSRIPILAKVNIFPSILDPKAPMFPSKCPNQLKSFPPPTFQTP